MNDKQTNEELVQRVRALEKEFIQGAEIKEGFSQAIVELVAETTKRKQEEENENPDSQIRLMIDSCPAWMACVDVDGNYLIANKYYNETFKIPLSQIEGHNFKEFFPPDLYERHKQLIAKSISMGKSLNWEDDHIFEEDRITYLYGTYTPLYDESGSLWAVSAFVQDITPLKQAEEKFKASETKYRGFLENINAGVVAHAPDTTILYSNQRALQLLGLSMDQLVRKKAIDPYWKFVNEDETDMLLEDFPVNLALKSKSELKDYVAGIVRPDKDYVTWVSCNSYSVINNNKLELVLISFFDITKRKRAEKEKDKLQAQLRQTHKMEAIGTMAGGIAHDFNNILAAMIGFSELARDDIPSFSPARDQIDQVLKAGKRARELIHHILMFSRMTSRVEKRNQINLNQIVSEVLKFQRSVIPSTIEIQSEIDKDCGMIEGDPTEIHQVLMNLCTNASHAMDKGGVLKIKLNQIELTANDLITQPDLDAGIFIKVSVNDTGTGITTEDLDSIFDPYFTTKKMGKGSGMGLALVHGIVKKHGGFVEVKSKLGKGSTFNIFFPTIDEKATHAEADKSTDIPTGTERILFVDDEDMLARVGKSILERLGYSVTALTDSTKVLDLFQNNPAQFDLVITDQTMPNLPGSELAKQLLQIRSDIPIIVCTGYSSMIDELKAQKIGIREFVMKPFTIKEIAKTIRKVLDA